MAQTINSAFPVLSVSINDVQASWFSSGYKSFFFCCSLEPVSESGDEFEFRLACYSQEVESNSGDQVLTFADLTSQPQPISGGETASPDLTSLVMNDMYILNDELSEIVATLTGVVEPQQLVFYPYTKQGDTKNNIAYALMFQTASGYISYTDLSSYLGSIGVTVIDISGRGAIQLNPCPPADFAVI